MSNVIELFPSPFSGVNRVPATFSNAANPNAEKNLETMIAELKEALARVRRAQMHVVKK